MASHLWGINLNVIKKKLRDIKEESTAVDIQKNGKEQREPEGESSQKTWKIFPTWKSFEIIVLVSLRKAIMDLVLYLEAENANRNMLPIPIVLFYSFSPIEGANKLI